MWVTSGVSITRTGGARSPRGRRVRGWGQIAAAVAEQDRGNVQLELVEQPGWTTWRSSVPPPATDTSLPPAASRANSMARSTPPVTRTRSRPPFSTSRARWVTTNTGARNGGCRPTGARRLEHPPAYDVGAGCGEVSSMIFELIDSRLPRSPSAPARPSRRSPTGSPGRTGRLGALHPAAMLRGSAGPAARRRSRRATPASAR